MNTLLIAILLMIAIPVVSSRFKGTDTLRRWTQSLPLVVGTIIVGVPLLLTFRWSLLAFLVPAFILMVAYPFVAADFRKVAQEYGRKPDVAGFYGTLFFLVVYCIVAMLGELYVFNISPFGIGILQIIVRELIFVVIARQLCRIAVTWLRNTWTKY